MNIPDIGIAGAARRERQVEIHIIGLLAHGHELEEPLEHDIKPRDRRFDVGGVPGSDPIGNGEDTADFGPQRIAGRGAKPVGLPAGRRRSSGNARPRRRTRRSPGARRSPCLEDARTCTRCRDHVLASARTGPGKRSSRSRSVIGLRRARARVTAVRYVLERRCRVGYGRT